LERLDAPRSRLTVLTASSGFGKTTLLREWVDRLDPEKVAALWVTLGSGITDPGDFWEVVLRAAMRQGLLPEDVWERIVNVAVAGGDPVEMLIDYLLRSGLTLHRDMVLVVDAYENVQVPGDRVDAGLLALVHQLPRLRVLVAGRAATGLASSGRVLRGDVEVIGQDELTFTRAEIAELVEHVGQSHLSVDRLERETYGYPLALRAVMLGIGDTGEPTDAPHWRSLVAADVLDRIDEGLRRFVLATAVPPYFDAALAGRLAALVTGVDAAEALAELEARGLGSWIPFAPGRPAFRYVGALRDAFVADLVGAHPELHARVAATCASWLFENGMHAPALDQAIAGAEYQLAEQVYRSLLLARPETYSSGELNTYLSRLPPAALVRHPVLAFARGANLWHNPATHQAAVELFQIAAVNLPQRMSGLSLSERVGQHTLRSMTLRALRRFAEAADAAEEGLAAYDAAEGVQPADQQVDGLDERRLLGARSAVLRQLAYPLFQVGRIDRAAAVIDRGITAATSPRSRNYTAVYKVGFHAFDGRLDATRAGQALVEPTAWRTGEERSFLNAFGRVGAAIMRLDAFDYVGAEREYDGCESFLGLSEFWAYITWTLMHARLGQGQALAEAHRVSEALRGPQLPPGVGDTLCTSSLRGTLAILWLAAGQPNAAREVLRRKAAFPGQTAPAVALEKLLTGEPEDLLTMLPGLEQRRGHTLRSRMATQVIGAAAALRQEDEGTAAVLLSRAAAVDAGGGARLHLAYLPPEDLAALRGLATRMGDRTASSYLAVEVPALFTSTESVPLLSERERAVLAALVDRETRAEVATMLYISENTVKTHLKNLYRKLGANSRETVLRRAIELDLLS